MRAEQLRNLTDREKALVGPHSARHGPVLAPRRPIADSTGGIGAPLVRVGAIAGLEQRGTITAQMADAAARFHTLFQRAGLDGLRAADLGRVKVSGGSRADDMPPSHDRCRSQIAAAVAALGGHGSLAASAVWHVAGLEWSVRRWAQHARRPADVAAGALIAALDVLAAHFAGERR